MIRQAILLHLVFASSSSAFSQQQYVPGAEYHKQTAFAMQYYITGKYKQAALSYDSAFAAAGDKAIAMDRFYAGFAWGAAGDKEKAMLDLEKAVRKDKFADVPKFQRETMLLKLEEHPKWNTLLELVKKNNEGNVARLEKPLATELQSIFDSDQADRLRLDSIQKKFGSGSKEMQAHWRIIHHKDSLNLIAVKKILDERGWLGADVVGEIGNSTLFLVIQHSDLMSQEKYLPLLRKAVMTGNAKPSELALLEDRTRTARGEKQLYGSQLKTNPLSQKLEFYPIEDKGNVNKRRAEMGLEPLEEYAKRFGLQYAPLP